MLLLLPPLHLLRPVLHHHNWPTRLLLSVLCVLVFLCCCQLCPFVATDCSLATYWATRVCVCVCFRLTLSVVVLETPGDRLGVLARLC